MNDIYFLTLDDIIGIHELQIELYGGSFGLRDKNLLEAAINMPSISFDSKYLHEDIFEMAAAYLFHIIKNHPFVDGNKRSAVVATLFFLEANTISIYSSEEDFFRLTISTATSEVSKSEIATFLRTHQVNSK